MKAYCTFPLSIFLIISLQVVGNYFVQADGPKLELIGDILENPGKRFRQDDVASADSENADPPGLDPVKCFPKALCGVSSEVEQISKRKKDGLVNEYLIIMKAISRHPDLLKDVVSAPPLTSKKKKDKPESDSPSDDTSDSEEDDEENNNESEEEDEVDEEQDDEPAPVVKNEKSTKRRKSKKKTDDVPKNDDDFNRAYLKEKLAMQKLVKNTMMNDDLDSFWDDGHPTNTKGRPHHGPHQGYGSNPHSHHSHHHQRPQGSSNNGRPQWGFGGSRPQSGPPNRGPPSFFRRGEEFPDSDSTASGSRFSKITSFFTNLFGIGDTSLTNDYWFPSAARQLSGEVAPGVAVQETREILQTALDVGKTFDKPAQCNEMFNACPYEYTELLYMIEDLRKNVRKSVKEIESIGVLGKQEDVKEIKLKVEREEEDEEGQREKPKNKRKSSSSSSSSNVDKKKKKSTTKSTSSKTVSTSNKSKKKKKTNRRNNSNNAVKKPSSMYSSSPYSTSDESGEFPDRYVIPVTPPPHKTTSFRDTFALPNVFSWLGF